MRLALRLRQHLGVPGIAAVAVVVAAVVAAGGLVMTHSSASRLPRHPATTKPRLTHALVRHRPGGPITVVSITPRRDASGVSYDPHITIRFSQALSVESPMPLITPGIRGNWVRVGNRELVFDPTANFAPFTRVSVYVPGGTRGILAADGKRLKATYRSHFSVRPGSTLRLQQLLAELGYLPVNFAPSGSGATGTQSSGTGRSTATTTTVATPTTEASSAGPSGPPGSGTQLSNAPSVPAAVISEPTREGDIPLTPLAGSFSWRYPNIPKSLATLWVPGAYNVMTEGAVMAFENAEGLVTDGVAGPVVWAKLLQAVAKRQVNTFGYDYVMVFKTSPEYVNLWRNGKVIFQTLANTGIPQSPTQAGTWPVYARYVTTTMSGTNPNGTHYSDPGIPWVSYFHGGDALHGFLRAQYGFPQSLGCVEMPYSSAHTLYPYTPLGTLVTVG